MSELSNRVTQAAKWLAVMLIMLGLLAQPVFGSKRQPVAKPGACCNKCQCCVTPNSGGAPTPVAPNSTRTTVAKDFQLALLLNALLAPESRVFQSAPFHSSVPDSSASVPLFVRHCTFLI